MCACAEASTLIKEERVTCACERAKSEMRASTNASTLSRVERTVSCVDLSPLTREDGTA